MQIKIKTTLAAATAALVITGNAATVSLSITAPTVDGLDAANLLDGGAANSEYKWFNDGGHNLGQTFTPTADATLTSFTIKMGAANAEESDTANFRIGVITRPAGVFTFTDIGSWSAEASPSSGSGDWADLDFVTYSLTTASPTLSAGQPHVSMRFVSACV